MTVLAIDTTSWNCSVALWEDGKELAFQEVHSERDQAALLPGLVQQVIKHHQIEQILVNVGPGSFTGIRLGLAFAHGLAKGWNIPLKGMDSFTITFLNLEQKEDVLVLIDGRRQDVFARRFRKGTPEEAQSLTRYDIEQLLTQPSPPSLAGNGVYPLLEGLKFHHSLPQWQGARALAYAYFTQKEKALPPLPFYVRDADVNRSSSC